MYIIYQLSAKFIIDNIASIGFGVEGESFTNADSKFFKMSTSIFDPSLAGMVRSLIALFVPYINKIFKVP